MKNKILKIYTGALFTFVFLFSAIVNGEWQDIHYAIQDNDVKTVKELTVLANISNGSHMTRDESGQTPLMTASSLCRIEIAKDLMHKMSKLQLNARDKDGNTALIIASESRCWTIVKELVDKGVFVNARNNQSESAYQKSIQNGDNYLAGLLKGAGASTKIKGAGASTN